MGIIFTNSGPDEFDPVEDFGIVPPGSIFAKGAVRAIPVDIDQANGRGRQATGFLVASHLQPCSNAERFFEFPDRGNAFLKIGVDIQLIISEMKLSCLN